MARTRSKPVAKGSAITETTTSATPVLVSSETNPPKLFILPTNLSGDARIISLPSPATSKPTRYYNCPENGLYEFVKVAAPRTMPRSLLFTSRKFDKLETPEGGIEFGPTTTSADSPAIFGSNFPSSEEPFATGYITRSADMFIATPVDPLFLLLPILSPVTSKDQKQMFLTFDDHIDNASEPLKRLLQCLRTRTLFEKRLTVVCDTVEAGEDCMFRLSIEKLAKEMAKKASAIVRKGLPASIEDRFVQRLLQTPVITMDREENSGSIVDETQVSSRDSQMPSIVREDSSQTPASSGGMQESQVSVQSQLRVAASEDHSTQQEDNSASENVARLLRLRTALAFISSSYIPHHLRTKVQTELEASALIDFAPLNGHMKHLESLREQARSLRSLSDNISRKRAVDDDEAMEARAEKKRKKEDEDQKKKNASRAVKQLNKVNTSGMKKMSSFFTKMPKK